MTSQNDRHVVFTQHLLCTRNAHRFWGHRSVCKSTDFPNGSEGEPQCVPQAQLLALCSLCPFSGLCSASVSSQGKQAKSRTHGAFVRLQYSNPYKPLSPGLPTMWLLVSDTPLWASVCPSVKGGSSSTYPTGL